MTGKSFLKMTKEERQAVVAKKHAIRVEKLDRMPTKIKEGYKNVPKSMQNLYLAVMVEKTTKTQRIKLKCLDCCCWDKEEVRQCTMKQCALWEVRPYKPKEN